MGYRWQTAHRCSFALLILVAKACTAADEGGEHLRLDENPNPMGQPWLSGLPPLSEDFSPTGSAWNNSIAICAIMKDEQLTDVREWLTYYRWLGVDHVFLTDNGSKDVHMLRTTLESEFRDFLTFRTEDTERAQMKAYAWCAEEQRSKFNWIAFFDMDEYLVLRRPSTDVPQPSLADVLDSYRHFAGLSVHWVWVGPSGQQTRPRNGGVLQHYTQCVPDVDVHIKTIVNTYYLEGLAFHPHNFYFRDGMRSVDENGVELRSEWRLQPACKRLGSTHPPQYCTRAVHSGVLPDDFERCCFSVPGAVSRPASAAKVALFHYATKSWEDFSAKMARGSGMSFRSKDSAYFDALQAKQRHEPICKEPAALWEHCCSDAAVGQQMRAGNLRQVYTPIQAIGTSISQDGAGNVQWSRL